MEHLKLLFVELVVGPCFIPDLLNLTIFLSNNLLLQLVLLLQVAHLVLELSILTDLLLQEVHLLLVKRKLLVLLNYRTVMVGIL